MKLSFNNFREQPIAVRARDVEFVREKKKHACLMFWKIFGGKIITRNFNEEVSLKRCQIALSTLTILLRYFF